MNNPVKRFLTICGYALLIGAIVFWKWTVAFCKWIAIVAVTFYELLTNGYALDPSQRISPWLYLIVILSALLAYFRVRGYKSQFFQAIAHLWVGGLFAIGIWGGGRVELWCAVALTVVETICFLFFRFVDQEKEVKVPLL